MKSATIAHTDSLHLRILVLAAAYALLGELSLSLTASHGIVTQVVFLPEGVALAATILWGRRVWPGVFIGQAILILMHGLPWLAALGVAAGNSLTAVLGAWLFERYGLNRSYDRIRDVGGLLLLCALVLQPISASVGQLSLMAAGVMNGSQWASSWLAWWFGNLIGQMVLTPLLLAWHAQPPWTKQYDHRQQHPWHHGSPILLATLMICLLLAIPQLRQTHAGLALLPPLTALLAAYSGMAVTTTAIGLFTLINLLLAHTGIFLSVSQSGDSLIEFDLSLLSLALVGQLVAALFAERAQAQRALARNHAQLVDAQRIAGVSSWEYDWKHRQLNWSDEIHHIFEVERSALATSLESFLAMVHPDDRARVEQAYRDSLHSGLPYRITHRLLLPDGRIKHIQENCETVFDKHSRPIRSCGTVLDVSALKTAEDRLHLYARAFEQSNEAILITDADNNIQEVNPAFSALTGYRPEEVIGRNPRVLASGHTPVSTYQNLWQSLQEKGCWAGELWDRRKDGSIYPKWAHLSMIRDSDGRVINHMASFIDISERKATEERLHHLAHHDALTGLANRLGLEFRLQQALLTAQREHQQIAALFIDMDRFKQINDTLGHHVGDLLLAEVAQRLRANARANDIIARLGGDEFVVILVGNIDRPAAIAIAAKLVERLAEPYQLDGHAVASSPSLGIALFKEHAVHATDLLKCADQAMYAAKQAGRNGWRMFDISMHDSNPTPSPAVPGA
jgi:diguanylate cyclase (GGDEF)-like protein/PAS domain S-box-containing protein